MAAVDQINDQKGRRTVRLVSTREKRPMQQTKRGRYLPHYTTRRDKLPIAET